MRERALAPHPSPLPAARGEGIGARTYVAGRTPGAWPRKIHLAPRSGERSTREARRVRGSAMRERALAPHPSPLPAARGEGIGARTYVAGRTPGAWPRKIHLAPRSGERSTREARRVRGSAMRERALAPHPSPLPAARGEGIGARTYVAGRTPGAWPRKIHLAPRSGERSTREACRVRGSAMRERALAPHPSPLPAARGEGIGARTYVAGRTPGAWPRKIHLAPRSGERSTREARRVRGSAMRERALAPHPSPCAGRGDRSAHVRSWRLALPPIPR